MSDSFIKLTSYCLYSEQFLGTATNSQGETLENIVSWENNKGTVSISYDLPNDLPLFWEDFKNPDYNHTKPIQQRFEKMEFELEEYTGMHLEGTGLKDFDKYSFEPESIQLDSSIEGEYERIQVVKNSEVVLTALWEPKFENKVRKDRWRVKTPTGETKLEARSELEGFLKAILV